METLILILLTAAVFSFFFRKEIKNKVAPQKDKNYNIDDLYNSEKKNREKEIDQILSKIGKNGLNDLSAKDKARLDELSKK